MSKPIKLTKAQEEILQELSDSDCIIRGQSLMPSYALRELGFARQDGSIFRITPTGKQHLEGLKP